MIFSLYTIQRAKKVPVLWHYFPLGKVDIVCCESDRKRKGSSSFLAKQGSKKPVKNLLPGLLRFLLVVKNRHIPIFTV